MRNQEEIIAKARADRRKFRRVRIDQPGKVFLPETLQEIPCMVVNISPGGAMVHCDAGLRWGNRVVLYIDDIGRFEGVVARVDGFGLGINFTSTALKRERTAEQLTVFVNRGLVDEHSLRRHERVQLSGFIRFLRKDASYVLSEVMDLSLSGISLKTSVRPPVGEFVLIGELAARVARHHDQGIGLEFVGITFANTDMVRAKLTITPTP
jgi:hypothetical protein